MAKCNFTVISVLRAIHSDGYGQEIKLEFSNNLSEVMVEICAYVLLMHSKAACGIFVFLWNNLMLFIVEPNNLEMK